MKKENYNKESAGNWIFLLISSFLAIALIDYVYWLVSNYAPQYLILVKIPIILFLFLAFVFVIDTIKVNKVRWYWWFLTWCRSWVAFLISLILMIGIWYGCYWLIANYALSRLVYFKWGFYISTGIVLIMLVFNELIVKLVTGARRIRNREDCPELWDAVNKVTPWHAKPTPRIYILPDSSMNAISFGWGLPFLSAVGATEGLIERLDRNELAAVMAHEIGHIINKDILVSMIMGLTTMIMAATGWMLLRLGPYGGSDRKSSDGKGGVALLIIIAVGFVMYIFGRLFGIILQAFVSRQREYAADATSARIVKTSKPLKTALLKIVEDPFIHSKEFGAVAGFLCTADPEPADLMATHPNMKDRLNALTLLEI